MGGDNTSNMLHDMFHDVFVHYVDSPVKGPLYHRLATSLRSAAHAVPGSGLEFSDIPSSPKSVASRSVFRKAGPLSSPWLGL